MKIVKPPSKYLKLDFDLFWDSPISGAPIRAEQIPVARFVGQLSSGMEGCNVVVRLFQDSVEDSQFVLILGRADFLAIF